MIKNVYFLLKKEYSAYYVSTNKEKSLSYITDLFQLGQISLVLIGKSFIIEKKIIKKQHHVQTRQYNTIFEYNHH